MAEISQLEKEAIRAEVAGDPMAGVLRGLVETVKAIEGAREVMGHADVDRIARAAATGAQRKATELAQGTLWQVTVVLLVMMLAGIGGGLWAGYRMGGAGIGNSGPAGLRAGQDKCEERADGSRLCWIPIWEKLPSGTR